MKKHAEIVTVTETQALTIKCAQLEFTLAHERSQRVVEAAMKTRDDVMTSAFLAAAPGADIQDYSYDMSTGTFTHKDSIPEQ